jgi:hypothetical protein
MAWRKWLVRGLVFSALGALGLVGLLYQAWTHPAAVRRLLLDKLGVRFCNVAVAVDSAHLRLLGGIVVHELRMSRSDGLDRQDFLYVPSALIYHDKEQMVDGKLAVRKVELTRPHLRVVRDRDGHLNLSGILGPIDLTERMPTIVVRHGTVLIEDRATAPAGPLLEIRDVHLTIINDPLPTLQVEGGGQTDVAGPVTFRAVVPRATLAVQAHVEFPAIPVGPDLVQRLAGFCPETAAHLRQLTATAAVEADVTSVPGDTAHPIHYEIQARLRGGELNHARLPRPLRNLRAEARCVNGQVPSACLTADCGPARVEAALKDLTIPQSTPSCIEEYLRELDVKIEHLSVDDDALARLPEDLQWIKEDYSPRGTVTVLHNFRRGRGGPAVKRWVVRAEGGRAVCKYFPYPVDGVTGEVEVDVARPQQRCVCLDLSGSAGGRPVSVRGTVRGPREARSVRVDVRGQGLVLDDKIMRALQRAHPRSHKVAQQFLPERCRGGGLRTHPMGKADFHAAIRCQAGEKRFQNIFTLTFRDTAVRYDLFPYPLEDVTGVLVIHPDHWECHDFRGTHAGGEIRVDGRSHGLPPGTGASANGSDGPRLVEVRIRGQGVKLDHEFGKALAPPGIPGRKALFNAWQTLALAGRMNFAAQVVDHPNRPQDLDVGVEIQGCTMKPNFFGYALSDVSGSARYTAGQVHLFDLQARHGAATLGLKRGTLHLQPAGGFKAWLESIWGKDLTPDENFLTALPEPLRKGLEPLRLSKPLQVETNLTIIAPPQPGGPLQVWWDGGALLRDAAFHAGVDVTGANGQVTSKGYHDGRQMHGAAGTLLLTAARILGQPMTNLHGRLEVRPDSPEVVRIRDLSAEAFGGSIGGEARLEVGAPFRYELKLDALGLRLEQFGKHSLGADASQAQLEGPARASLHLQGEGADILGLKGNGRIDVAGGKMGRLPVLLDLLKAFGLRMPDRTAFEQAHVTFAIEGPRVRVNQLDLYGNAISLRGQGTVDLDGSNVNLDFSATPGRVTQMLPAGIDVIPQAISQQLFKIKARGKVGKGGLRFEKEFVPGVVEPIKRAIGQ